MESLTNKEGEVVLDTGMEWFFWSGGLIVVMVVMVFVFTALLGVVVGSCTALIKGHWKRPLVRRWNEALKIVDGKKKDVPLS